MLKTIQTVMKLTKKFTKEQLQGLADGTHHIARNKPKAKKVSKPKVKKVEGGAAE